jgi:hypothetical protein
MSQMAIPVNAAARKVGITIVLPEAFGETAYRYLMCRKQDRQYSR